MRFYSLPTGKLHKKPRQNRLKNFPARYVEKFYRNLTNSIDNVVGSDFYGRIVNDSIIRFKYLFYRFNGYVKTYSNETKNQAFPEN